MDDLLLVNQMINLEETMANVDNLSFTVPFIPITEEESMKAHALCPDSMNGDVMPLWLTTSFHH